MAEKTKADIWMPFYVGDYLADTMHLSPAEHGGYLMLILHYWKSGPIPDDDVRLSIISRMGDAWSNASATIRAFFEHADGMLVHKRIDMQKADAVGNKDKKTTRAKAAADARWGKNATSNATSNAQALLDECPSSSPSSIKEKTLVADATVIDLPKKDKPVPSDEDMKTAQWLAKKQVDANPTCKQPNIEGWAQDVRLMRAIDGRSHRDICELFRWAKADDFWAPNIQSAGTLRKQWDKLTEKRMRAAPSAAPDADEWKRGAI